jgi:hypothetical protein
MTARSLTLCSLLALALALAAGCDCSGQLTPRTMHDASTDSRVDSGPSISGLTSFTIAPLDTTLTIVDGVAASQTYTAMGHFSDGSSRDISTQVQWSIVASHVLGTFTSNVFNTGSTSGGTGQVAARANGMAVMTSLTVIVRASHAIPPTGGGATIPPSPGTLFGGAADASRAPPLV